MGSQSNDRKKSTMSLSDYIYWETIGREGVLEQGKDVFTGKELTEAERVEIPNEEYTKHIEELEEKLEDAQNQVALYRSKIENTRIQREITSRAR